MTVLHAHWQPSHAQLLLWAEMATSQRQARKQHPHGANPEALRGQLEPLGIDLKHATSSTASLWLPTTGKRPQLSPALQQNPPENLRLEQWTVRGLALPPADAALALIALPSSDTGRVHLGDDLRYWQQVVWLALEALAQHKLLPDLAQHEGSYLARWRPVLTSPKDSARLTRLEQHMPSLCRAETDDPEHASAAAALLESFLTLTCDALARRWGTPPNLKPAEPAERWLLALFGDTKSIKGSAAQLEHLVGSHRNWQRPLSLAGDARSRVAFRLEEPGEGKHWTLHFLLQAQDDPSLIASAAEVWRGSTLAHLGERFEGAQEKLLAGLGYAARLFEPLRAGLKTATPERLELKADDAFRFLREAAPLLEEGGFGVLVPPWWTRPSARLGVRLTISSQPAGGVAEGMLKLQQLVRYRWEVALGDTSLSQEEFGALVALKSPLVQVRGSWVRLDPDQVEAAVRFFEKRERTRSASLLEALQLGLGGADSVEGLPVEDVRFEGEIAGWLERLQGNKKLKPLPPPKTFQGTLRPYQRQGVSWLAFMRHLGLGACLADDMGLGKTAQTLALLLHEREAGRLEAPSLLIAPTSVVTNWQKELAHFAPSLRAMIHQGADRLKGKAFLEALKDADLVITSYSLVRRDAELLAGIDWAGVVLDEAQNIKNPGAQQTRTIRALKAGFRVALTGTPVENRLSELWSIMHFLNPGYLGSRRTFRAQLGLPIEREGDEDAVARLRRLTQPFILRRVKTDRRVIQDLPEKIEGRAYCHLSEEQASLYQGVVQDAMRGIAEGDGIERQGLVLSMLTRLKQICNHPAQFLHEGETGQVDERRSAKLQRLVELLEETLEVQESSLIFTQFREMGGMLERYLQERLGADVLFLHGGTPAKKRAALVERFQEDGGPKLFILSLKAGGTGLNLTRATHVFHFDRWWNPAVEDQATDRAFRIGQKRNVQVHKFVTVGTLEEKIDAIIEAKQGLAQSIVGTGESWLAQMSTKDLRDLVSLRQEVLA